ncbi:MAG: serine hydrolase [Pseudomonadota bacterium]
MRVRPHWSARAFRVAVATAALAMIVLASLAVYAPQALVLARDGFPSATWTGEGRFARVQGVQQEDAPIAPDIPQAAHKRFTDSGGRALLVDRGGRVAFETYGAGISSRDRLNSFSLIKSLVGALALKAVADGRIAHLGTPLRHILGPDVPDVTLDDALRMQTGLKVNGEPAKPVEDAGFSPFSPLAELHVYGLASILPDLRIDPGKRGQFSYQSVNTALIGAALEEVYQRPLPELLSEFIWKPAGAADAYWLLHAKVDTATAYCCLFARPSDWLRVGRFLMNNGTPDAPFLPEELWRAFLLPDFAPEKRRAGAYGWHLRHDVLDRSGASVRGPFAYFLGHNGQVVYLLPESDTVVVRFGREMQLLHSTLYELLDTD